jgi:hypothetical protein
MTRMERCWLAGNDEEARTETAQGGEIVAIMVAGAAEGGRDHRGREEGRDAGRTFSKPEAWPERQRPREDVVKWYIWPRTI